ncbi:NRAMP family divalent metal transporter [Roseivirga sp. E12]|uniref:NRAMP family divalent metal transporter n=1 Tax=Roseivirga sp. E12 TaxID=2819237 RepID=UPI001ABC8B42|nr:divalent metal cation transporter [Roseivirga sp. E12]MBO3700561.1 divalent metal cation transporter [Roseivirga sp. E12]
MKSKFWNFIFWLVIAAAFIGPGTVTTAASAGANHQYQLLWALLFSTFACVILQEAAARVSIVTSQSLGGAIQDRFQSSKLVWFIAIAVFLGCAAYEAGNILGAISGLALIVTGVPAWIFTIIIVVVAAIVLFAGNINTVANLLGIIVALMGLAFLYAALSLKIDAGAFFEGLVVPKINEKSALLTLGLVGTTIVPYNIFLGSGLAKGQTVKQMRSGMIPSIVLGGIISMAVLVVGTSLIGEFGFGNLHQQLVKNHGAFMGIVFGVGLFAAGFTSSITAALAGAITIKSATKSQPDEQSWRFRSVWILVLLTGLIFGVSNVKPIPVIILAQAANGFILPLLAFILWIMVNHVSSMKDHKNTLMLNVFMGITVFVTAMLGFINVFKAVMSVIGETFAFSGGVRLAILLLAGLTLVYGIIRVRKEQKA